MLKVVIALVVLLNICNYTKGKDEKDVQLQNHVSPRIVVGDIVDDISVTATTTTTTTNYITTVKPISTSTSTSTNSAHYANLTVFKMHKLYTLLPTLKPAHKYATKDVVYYQPFTCAYCTYKQQQHQQHQQQQPHQHDGENIQLELSRKHKHKNHNQLTLIQQQKNYHKYHKKKRRQQQQQQQKQEKSVDKKYFNNNNNHHVWKFSNQHINSRRQIVLGNEAEKMQLKLQMQVENGVGAHNYNEQQKLLPLASENEYGLQNDMPDLSTSNSNMAHNRHAKDYTANDTNFDIEYCRQLMKSLNADTTSTSTAQQYINKQQQKEVCKQRYDELNESSTMRISNSYYNYGEEEISLPRLYALQHKLAPKAQRLFAGITGTASSGGVANWHWPIKREAVVEGDLILGGLMMVHSREDTIICGRIMPQGGIQALEAMLYTIDRINESGLLPNITLGAHVLDDCDKDTYGLEMAVDFIKGSISNIDDTEYYCNKTQVRKVISGVVGASSSVTSIQVANLLRLFRIPQVSFFSTSPELSNKQRFEYFTRTIPSDHYQVKAMVEIVKRLGWSYVSIIYEESNYGIKAFEELEDLLAHNSICIAVKEKLVKDSGVAEEIAYDNIVQKLLTKPRARGAIIFGSDQEVREVMRAVRRNNATGAFSWIGSDGWSARNLVSDGNEPEVEGTLSVQPQANPVKGFEKYFLNLTVENNQRNPWFVEFWEDHFQCRYPGSPPTPYNDYNRTCTTKEQLTAQNTDFEDQLQFVSDAVMAFAYAVRDMHRDLCGGQPTLCDEMKPTKGADLLKYLRKVEFQGLSGDHFRFDGNGDGPARYNIIHFKQSKEGQYHWVRVGEYYEGELRLNMSEVQFKLLNPKPPESVCSLPCESGQAKKYVEGESCCWHCFNCSMYQIRDQEDETQCISCKNGTLPNASKQECLLIPEVYLRPESAWAIGAMSFSAIGMMLTLFIVSVFVRHNNTPIVRASGRELSYILLAGILMCYAVTFVLVLKPTNLVCAIQRFMVGFCFTVVYAALLTKTNRIARIFKAGKQSAKRPSFISPKSQLVICSFLISIQILINGIWMLIAHPHAMYHHPTREDNLLVCDSYIDASYMIAFFYPIVLIVICTVYAVLTRKIPEAFNESKHIGFTMYTTCVIWLAFVPLYFGTANHVPLRITSMSVTISLSASVTIACLFSPKLYIILIRPERNVRQSMMPPRYGNLPRSTGSGPPSVMAATVVAADDKSQNIAPTCTEQTENKNTRKLCEIATQTITLSNIFITLDTSTYNAIPYADQYVVPNNNNHQIQTQTQTQTQLGQNTSIGQAFENVNNVALKQLVSQRNDINQQQNQKHSVEVNSTTTASICNTMSNVFLDETMRKQADDDEQLVLQQLSKQITTTTTTIASNIPTSTSTMASTSTNLSTSTNTVITTHAGKTMATSL